MIRKCAHCGQDISYDELFGDWFHTQEQTIDAFWCRETNNRATP